jgi:hypothetical protein
MSKYEPLWNRLKAEGSPIVKLSCEEIKAILGFDIDHSFLTYKKEATQFGYQVDKISMIEGWETFLESDSMSDRIMTSNPIQENGNV